MNDTQITLTGLVGGDVTLRELSGDRCVASFRVACTPSHFRDGAWVRGTPSWHTMKAWNRLARNVADSLHTGEPVIVRDFQSQNEYVISAFLKHHGIVSLANAPMLIGASTWGVLEVDSTVPRDFGPDSSDFLVAAGTIIGAYILTLIGNLVFILRISSYWQPVASGVILLVAVLASAIAEKAARRRTA